MSPDEPDYVPRNRSQWDEWASDYVHDGERKWAQYEPLFGMHRTEWPDDDSVEFHLPHGEMISLLRSSGFAVEALMEVQAPEGSSTRYPFVSLEWSRRWPCEEVWKARKLG